MLKNVEVKRISLGELPMELFYLLMHKYHVEQWDFVVMFDKKNQILYVNKTVTNECVSLFKDVITWDKPGINDPDCPIADVVDYIYKTYGWNTWNILMDAYMYRQNEIRKEKTQARMEEILPLIQKEIRAEIDGEIEDISDECLIDALFSKGMESVGDNRHVNPWTFGKRYIFFFGYLMGTGQIAKEGEGPCNQQE